MVLVLLGGAVSGWLGVVLGDVVPAGPQGQVGCRVHVGRRGLAVESGVCGAVVVKIRVVGRSLRRVGGGVRVAITGAMGRG